MRTETIKIYSFNELSEKAQQTAIEYHRNKLYEYNDFSEWAIDNCFLLEPPHKELINLFGDDFYKELNKHNKYDDNPLIENNRKIYFSLGRNRYIDISNAMEVQNDHYFLEWLGLDEELIEITDYEIGTDTIDFDTNDFDIEYSGEQQRTLMLAKEKFEDHCENILQSIEADIDYRFTDEAIIEEITADESEFLENGDLYFF